MILTVTLNPMLDKTVRIEPLRRGAIHRSTGVECVVGGKGVNVARQLKQLGVEAIATGFLGGEIGTLCVRLLDEEGISHQFVMIRGMTREGVTYLEPDGTWTAVFEPPHQVAPDETRSLVRRCESVMSSGSWVVCSGSSPCLETDGIYAEIIAMANQRGCQSYLDSYGAAFQNGLQERPTFVQCNRNELKKTFSRECETEAEIRTALEEFLASGVRGALVTDGARPAYASDGKTVWRITPPPITTVNPTGSGDSMAAGILARLSGGATIEEALRFGSAAGAANAGVWAVASSTHEMIARLEAGVTIEKV